MVSTGHVVVVVMGFLALFLTWFTYILYKLYKNRDRTQIIHNNQVLIVTDVIEAAVEAMLGTEKVIDYCE